ncbi:GNAT family N-acetyltransferase [Streptomyces sp. NPDC101393]|uniref:GNAT family N-acetyltransferase n=1 Tax=Streptomyces sp. NPDC101393 TaxID=3366141 RepID=UPI0038223F75
MAFIPVRLTPDILMRPAAPEDAAGLSRAYGRNRDHLRPWEPRRDEGFFTPEGQSRRLRDQLAEQHAGRLVPWVLVQEAEAGTDPEFVGTITLSPIVLGPLRSAGVGYWIAAGQSGRGLATAALNAVCVVADEELGLHRIEAGTLPDNHASPRVLAKCGFTHYGTAERYLHINGAWRDHSLFQKILNDRHA